MAGSLYYKDILPTLVQFGIVTLKAKPPKITVKFQTADYTFKEEIYTWDLRLKELKEKYHNGGEYLSITDILLGDLTYKVWDFYEDIVRNNRNKKDNSKHLKYLYAENIIEQFLSQAIDLSDR